MSENKGSGDEFVTLGGVLADHAKRLSDLSSLPAWAQAGARVARRYEAMKPRLPFAAEPVAGQGAARSLSAAPGSAGEGGGDLSLAPPAEPETPMAETARQADAAIAAAEAAPSTGLDGDLVRRIEDLLDSNLPPIRVSTGTRADAAARAQLADALTIDETVYFRAGQFRPDRPEGVALIAHEIVHADAVRALPEPGPGSDGAKKEEGRALAAEARVLAALSGRPPLRLGPLAPVSQSRVDPHPDAPPDLPARPGARRPRTAAQDRAIEVEPNAAPRPAARLSEEEMREIKESVYRDLMERIRTDFERGG